MFKPTNAVMTARDRERFSTKWRLDPETGCWVWTAANFGVSNRGEYRYGRFLKDGGSMGAHRASYLLHIGPVPEGRLVCHRCNNPLCVNPEHLYAGTPQDNMRDKVWAGHAYGAPRKPFCKRGHEMVGENVGHHGTTGYRFCRECTRVRAKARAIN